MKVEELVERIHIDYKGLDVMIRHKGDVVPLKYIGITTHNKEIVIVLAERWDS